MAGEASGVLRVKGHSSHPGGVALSPHDNSALQDPVDADEVILAPCSNVPSVVAPGNAQQAPIIALHPRTPNILIICKTIISCSVCDLNIEVYGRVLNKKIGHGRAKKELSQLSYNNSRLVVVSGLHSLFFTLPCPTVSAISG